MLGWYLFWRCLLGQAGLAPENWLVVKQKANGELIILNKYHDTIRVIPPLAG